VGVLRECGGLRMSGTNRPVMQCHIAEEQVCETVKVPSPQAILVSELQ